MPLVKLACTALERVPLTRPKITEKFMKKFHQDLVSCRAPADNDLTKYQGWFEKIDPLFKWLESKFGYKPVVYSGFLDCELVAIDAIAAAGAHSLVITIGIFRGRLNTEEAIELIRLREDLQVDNWGLVEGGHDVDIADLKVQVASAAVLEFLQGNDFCMLFSYKRIPFFLLLLLFMCCFTNLLFFLASDWTKLVR
ncbi:unnamed protein product [Coffea canephora]|uniref:ATP synthase mitochondrial F1 complex assembly factor 2 n=1 Tax=Coffea canephora TaxID=49390 RepID=A0A068V4T3_COFCA|nr:unnamed protein product [Coffea canephora]